MQPKAKAGVMCPRWNHTDTGSAMLAHQRQQFQDQQTMAVVIDWHVVLHVNIANTKWNKHDTTVANLKIIDYWHADWFSVHQPDNRFDWWSISLDPQTASRMSLMIGQRETPLIVWKIAVSVHCCVIVDWNCYRWQWPMLLPTIVPGTVGFLLVSLWYQAKRYRWSQYSFSSTNILLLGDRCLWFHRWWYRFCLVVNRVNLFRDLIYGFLRVFFK